MHSRNRFGQLRIGEIGLNATLRAGRKLLKLDLVSQLAGRGLGLEPGLAAAEGQQVGRQRQRGRSSAPETARPLPEGHPLALGLDGGLLPLQVKVPRGSGAFHENCSGKKSGLIAKIKM